MNTSTIAYATVAGAAIAAMGLMATTNTANASATESQPQGQDLGARLVQGLTAVDGCLGVEAAGTNSGKRLIFAWFEDKAAAKDWYYSETHQDLMKMAGSDGNPRGDEGPMAHFADDIPIMVIASITPSQTPELEGIPMPISQIAIELYTPLPGGAELNGRFAPEALKVDHMTNYAEQ